MAVSVCLLTHFPTQELETKKASDSVWHGEEDGGNRSPVQCGIRVVATIYTYIHAYIHTRTVLSVLSVAVMAQAILFSLSSSDVECSLAVHPKERLHWETAAIDGSN